MKILHNFNTSYHKQKFIELLSASWEKNILLFQRHLFYLFPAFFYWLLSLFWFLCVNISIYFQFQVYPKILLIYISIAILVYVIWSFTLFIGYIRVLKWSSPIATLQSEIINVDNKFNFFIKLSIILFIVRICMLSLSIFLEFYLPHPDRILGFPAIYLHVFSCIIYLLWVYLVVYKVIRYSMSYCLVTLDTLEIVEQNWFFRRRNIIIQSKRLSLVSIVSEGLFPSIFRFGDIYFHNDSSNKWEEDMYIEYVPKPHFLKDKIQKILQNSTLE